MEKTKTFVSAILSGAMISIVGVVNLCMDNKIAGAFLFSVGLFYVVARQYSLYTGKVGYIVENKVQYLLELLTIAVGNFVGAFIVGNAMHLTRQQAIIEKAWNLCNVKINDTVISIFILAAFCGVLMYLAVDSYKAINDSFGKNFAVIMSVIVFILCGFEHCVANMFYFSAAGMWSPKVFFYIIVMILGNSFGSIIISGTKKFIVCNKK